MPYVFVQFHNVHTFIPTSVPTGVPLRPRWRCDDYGMNKSAPTHARCAVRADMENNGARGGGGDWREGRRGKSVCCGGGVQGWRCYRARRLERQPITPPASGVMLSSCVEGSTKCCPPAFELAAFGEMTSGTCDELGQRGRAGRGGL